jgi:hypothetical protein
MQLALLSGANPIQLREAPIVRLQAGNWRIDSDHINSIMQIRVYPSMSEIAVDHGYVFRLNTPGEVQVEMIKRGTEKYISTLVTKVD